MKTRINGSSKYNQVQPLKMMKINDIIIRLMNNGKNVLPNSEEVNKIAQILNKDASSIQLMVLNYEFFVLLTEKHN